MSVSIDIRLKRPSKVYHEGDLLSGIIVISCSTETKYEALELTVEGSVNLQLSSKGAGRLESISSSAKPIRLIYSTFNISKAGRLPQGVTEIPFELPLQGRTANSLFETYHGVFISINYLLKVDIKRGLLARDVEKTCEFIVEYKKSEDCVPQPVNFVITPQSLQKTHSRTKVPSFKISGTLDSVVCPIAKAFTGVLNIEHCAVPIKSVELQLVRVETCGSSEGYGREATEIQNIQIGDGDVLRNVPIPIYMVLPRLFACPTLTTSNFKIEFEINIVVVFHDNHLVTENFPVRIIR